MVEGEEAQVAMLAQAELAATLEEAARQVPVAAAAVETAVGAIQAEGLGCMGLVLVGLQVAALEVCSMRRLHMAEEGLWVSVGVVQVSPAKPEPAVLYGGPTAPSHTRQARRAIFSNGECLVMCVTESHSLCVGRPSTFIISCRSRAPTLSPLFATLALCLVAVVS